MAGLSVLAVEGGGDAVALKFEGAPTPTLGAGVLDEIAPRGGIGDIAFGELQGAIEADLVAEAAAEQIADRRLEEPAGQIPKGDLDAGRSIDGDPADGA